MIVHIDLTDFELLFGAQLLTDPALIAVRALNPDFDILCEFQPQGLLYQAGISTADRATIALFNQASCLLSRINQLGDQAGSSAL